MVSSKLVEKGFLVVSHCLGSPDRSSESQFKPAVESPPIVTTRSTPVSPSHTPRLKEEALLKVDL